MPAARECLKCGAAIPAEIVATPDGACPACGAIYRKVIAAGAPKQPAAALPPPPPRPPLSFAKRAAIFVGILAAAALTLQFFATRSQEALTRAASKPQASPSTVSADTAKAAGRSAEWVFAIIDLNGEPTVEQMKVYQAALDQVAASYSEPRNDIAQYALKMRTMMQEKKIDGRFLDILRGAADHPVLAAKGKGERPSFILWAAMYYALREQKGYSHEKTIAEFDRVNGR